MDGAGNAVAKPGALEATEPSQERTSEFIPNLKSIKMDEIGVQSVQSKGEQREQWVKQSLQPMTATATADHNRGQHSPSSQQRQLAMQQLYNQYSGQTSRHRFEGYKLAKYQLSNRPSDKVGSNQKPTSTRHRSVIPSGVLMSDATPKQPTHSGHTEDNFFKNIERNPHIPLELELKVQEQIRVMERKVRRRAEQVKAIKQMNSKQQKVQTLLYEQNQKLKDLFMQVFGINLGNDPLETSANLQSRQYSAKKAMSATTLGDKSQSPPKQPSRHEGSQ